MEEEYTTISFKQFVEYFLHDNKKLAKEYLKKFTEYDENIDWEDEDNECYIDIYYKYEDDSNCWIKLLWRVDEKQKWIKTRYNGSSPFAYWWGSIVEN